MDDIGQDLKCLSCGSDMVLEKRLKNGRSKEGIHRKRRFKCTVCDYSELIHANGAKDVTAFELTDSEKADIKIHREYKEE